LGSLDPQSLDGKEPVPRRFFFAKRKIENLPSVLMLCRAPRR